MSFVEFAGKSLWLFFTSTLAVYAISWLALRQHTHPSALEFAVTCDLTLFVPALYWLLLVRGRGWPLFSVLPVFLASLLVASVLLPEDRQDTLRAVKYLAVPAELALVGLLAHRAVRAIRLGLAHVDTDDLTRIGAAVHGAIPNRRAAEIIAFEIAVLWYALFKWRRQASAGADSFSYHRKSGYTALVSVILLAIVVELIPIHALLARWSAPMAWVVSGLSLYGALWLLGDLRAMQLHPMIVTDDCLVIRFGLRWNVVIARDTIEEVEVRGSSAEKDPADLRLALPGARLLRMRLNQPVEARGPYGFSRSVRVLELGVDDPERLAAALVSASA